MKPKSISVKILFCVLAIITLIIGGATIFCILNLRHSFTKLEKDTAQYYEAEYYIDEFLSASNYLTEQSRLFVINQDVQYLNNYCIESTQKIRRQIAVAKLDEITTGDEIYSKENPSGEILMEALIISDELQITELHAMKLMASALEIPTEKIHSEVNSFKLPAEEINLPNEQKKKIAYNLLFDSEYQSGQKLIREKQDQAKDIINHFTKTNQDASLRRLSISVTLMQIFSGLLIALSLLMFLITYTQLLIPIAKFMNSIKEDKPLDEPHSLELGLLANTYNRINQIQIEKTTLLKEKAERDALTKLYNRQYFQQNASHLTGREMDLILIIIDIDVFKQINDTYGHDIGDKIIIKVSNLIRDYLGGDQDTYRIGGDEFCVFVKNKDTSYFEELKNKISRINKFLQNPTDNLPKASISAGIAYSKNGYSEELYNNTDKALYQTKEAGRCGSSFFEENLEELSLDDEAM